MVSTQGPIDRTGIGTIDGTKREIRSMLSLSQLILPPQGKKFLLEKHTVRILKEKCYFLVTIVIGCNINKTELNFSHYQIFLQKERQFSHASFVMVNVY